MTDWELQQVTDTIVMAHEKRLMPTISAMLIALSDERAAVLKALRAAQRAIHGELCSEGHNTCCEAASSAIEKAES